MKKIKKFLALVIAVLMLLSVAPAAFAEEAVEDDSTSITAGDLFGGFFVKIGELLNTVFEFLSNLFSGASGNGQLEALK